MRYGSTIYASIYSKALVLFKSQKIGLPIGRKDKLDQLPKSILMHGKTNAANLLAGLCDTEGSVKVRKPVSGPFPRISIAQNNRGIVEDVKQILRNEFSITSTLYKNEYIDTRLSKVEVRWFLDINGYENLRRFREYVGSRHPIAKQKVRNLISLRE